MSESHTAGYEDDGVVNNLLGIRNAVSDAPWTGGGGSSVTSEANYLAWNSPNISKLYEQKFLVLYDNYRHECEAKNGPVFDLSDHLMCLCLDHLREISCWARASGKKMQWIHATLDENPDLRPEVRNGLALIIIYIFSAAKAKANKSDMFLILQDATYGLGIVNKTSLKIYNDPFNYFNFMKACITGLIDAGVVPENERLNQPKKAKRQVENKEEISAYNVLKGAIIKLIEKYDSVSARLRIQDILALWQQKTKASRNQRFTIAVLSLNHPPSFQPQGTAAALLSANANKKQRIRYLSEDHSDEGLDEDSNSDQQVPPYPLPSTVVPVPYALEQEYVPVREHAVENYQADLHTRIPKPLSAIPCLQFTRVGLEEWNIHDTRVFDVQTFLESSKSLGLSIYLIDDTACLTDAEKESLMYRSTHHGSFLPISLEFRNRKGLVASWLPSQYAQLQGLLSSYLAASVQTSPSLIATYNSSTAAPCITPSQGTAGRGYLAYEVIFQVGIIVRVLNPLSDAEPAPWRVVYATELAEKEQCGIKFQELLVSMFPQIKEKIRNPPGSKEGEWVVKYCAHRCDQPIVKPPARGDPEFYQTLGVGSLRADMVLARLDPMATFHDFVLTFKCY